MEKLEERIFLQNSRIEYESTKLKKVEKDIAEYRTKVSLLNVESLNMYRQMLLINPNNIDIYITDSKELNKFRVNVVKPGSVTFNQISREEGEFVAMLLNKFRMHPEFLSFCIITTKQDTPDTGC